MQREKYGVKADIWSLGIIFYTMICSSISYSSDFYTGRPKNIRTQAMQRKERLFFQTLDGIPDDELLGFIKSMVCIEQ
jgi:serine/threonine protein kinase